MTGRIVIIPRESGRLLRSAGGHEDRLPIGRAALVLGVHVQTLRSYERKGLIAATRTPGGERRFRLADLVADLVALRDGQQAAS